LKRGSQLVNQIDGVLDPFALNDARRLKDQKILGIADRCVF
jgi:hypothetical protein